MVSAGVFPDRSSPIQTELTTALFLLAREEVVQPVLDLLGEDKDFALDDYFRRLPSITEAILADGTGTVELVADFSHSNGERRWGNFPK